MSLEKEITNLALRRALDIIKESIKSNEVIYPKDLGGGANSEVPLDTVSQHVTCDYENRSISLDNSAEHVREYNRAKTYGNLSHIIAKNLSAENFISILKEVKF